MAASQPQTPGGNLDRFGPLNIPPSRTPSHDLDRFIVIHVATTCDEHGVYVTKDSAEVIEIGWILLDAKSCEEVRSEQLSSKHLFEANEALTDMPFCRSLETVCL